LDCLVPLKDCSLFFKIINLSLLVGSDSLRFLKTALQILNFESLILGNRCFII
jgi:hypothetical protein